MCRWVLGWLQCWSQRHPIPVREYAEDWLFWRIFFKDKVAKVDRSPH